MIAYKQPAFERLLLKVIIALQVSTTWVLIFIPKLWQKTTNIDTKSETQLTIDR